MLRAGVTDEGTAAGAKGRFTYYPNMCGNSTMRPKEKQAMRRDMKPEAGDAYFASPRVYECPLTTVSKTMRALDVTVVHLLKVDVEGEELRVLRGVRAAHWTCIRQVSMEVHDVDNRVQACVSLLEGFGFRVVTAPTSQGAKDAWHLYAVKVAPA